MPLQELRVRSDDCELCHRTEDLSAYSLTASPTKGATSAVLVCGICLKDLKESNFSEATHWQCLNEAMWSEIPAVKILSYRILQNRYRDPWARDLLDQMYLEESELNWANAGLFETITAVDSGAITKDTNGAQLQEGDSVTLIKDLDVKGAGFTAKRGTLVKNIRLTNNPEQIDARVNGMQIVLITKFLKKV